MGTYNPREKKRARMIFKKLKAGIVKIDELDKDDLDVFLKYYGWVVK